MRTRVVEIAIVIKLQVYSNSESAYDTDADAWAVAWSQTYDIGSDGRWHTTGCGQVPTP